MKILIKGSCIIGSNKAKKRSNIEVTSSFMSFAKLFNFVWYPTKPLSKDASTMPLKSISLQNFKPMEIATNKANTERQMTTWFIQSTRGDKWQNFHHYFNNLPCEKWKHITISALIYWLYKNTITSPKIAKLLEKW